MVGSKRFINCRSRVTTRTDRSQMSFSNKLFIFCSVWFVLLPAVASISQWVQGCRPSILLCGAGAPPTKTARAIFTSELSELDCNVRSRIYEHVAGVRRFTVSRKKQVHNLVGFLQGLAIIVLYSLSFVVSVVSLLVLLVNTVYSASRSSIKYQHTVSVASDMDELKNNVVVLFVVSLLMFQSAVFHCVAKQHILQGKTRFRTIIKNLLHKSSLLQRPFRLYRLKEIVCMLLLLSGDVELNPGPNGKEGSKDQNTGHAVGNTQNENRGVDSGYMSNASATDSNASSETVHVPLSNTFYQHKLLLLPMEEEVKPKIQDPMKAEPNPVQGNSWRRTAPLLGAALKSSRFSSPELRNSIVTVTSNVPEESVPMRKSKSEERYGLTDVSTDRMKCFFDRKPSFNHNKRRSLSYELTADDCARDGFDSPSKQQESATDEENLKQYAKKLGVRMSEFITQLRKNSTVWTAKYGFKSDTLDNTLFQFYFLANQLIRYKRECPLCLICGKLKTNNSSEANASPPNSSEANASPPNSHIFPRAALLTYIDIHGESSVKSNCIYDSSTPEDGMISARKLTVPMFCTSCESNASYSEGLFRDLYLYIMDPDHQEKPIMIKHPEWLRHVLVTIMLRGMLLINFLSEVQHDFKSFIKILIILRNYVKKKIWYKKCSQDDIPKEISENFGLFVLPFGHFVLGNDVPLSLFDLSLRCPRQTSIVRRAGKTFLYTQFDCFHCVLPINSKLQDHSLDLRKNYLYSKVIHQYISLEPSEERYDYIHIPSSTERKNVFPTLLLEVNMERMLKLGIEILTSPDDCRIYINRFPEKLPTPKLAWHPPGTQVQVETDTHEFERIVGQSRDILKDQCEKAAEYSPLRDVARIRKDSNSKLLNQVPQEDSSVTKSKDEQIKNLTQQVRDVNLKAKEKLADNIKTGTKRNEEIKILKNAIKKLEDENKQLKAEVARLADTTPAVDFAGDNGNHMLSKEGVFEQPEDKLHPKEGLAGGINLPQGEALHGSHDIQPHDNIAHPRPESDVEGAALPQDMRA